MALYRERYITPRIVTAEGENVPARVNQPGFGRSATSADYEMVELPKSTEAAANADGKES